MKKMIVGLLTAAALVGGVSSMAEAKTRIHVYLGVPYYDYQVGPDYRFDDQYGWYEPGSQYNDRRRMHRQDFRPQYGNRISCGEARGLVRQSGFREVRVRECDGRTYTFMAIRNNHRVIVYVNSRSGAVYRG
jgi:hypothetical protein